MTQRQTTVLILLLIVLIIGQGVQTYLLIRAQERTRFAAESALAAALDTKKSVIAALPALRPQQSGGIRPKSSGSFGAEHPMADVGNHGHTGSFGGNSSRPLHSGSGSFGGNRHSKGPVVHDSNAIDKPSR